ncbi:MAG: matrixin family metalloprotease, partial [Vicinamibacteria bacterium]
MRSQSWLFLSLALTAGAVEGARTAGATIPPAVCFAQGTDPAYVARTYASVGGDVSVASQPESFQFNIANRWNGAGLQGMPIVLTWSVIPDGTSIPAAGVPGEVTAPSNLRARLNAIYGSQAVWQPVFQQMFDAWGALTGTSYQFVNDDGAVFPNSPGSTARGDVRIGGHRLDGNFNVLAYNYFPNNGDMVIDTEDSFYTNTSNGSLGLRNVLAHEHGHGLGINHVCPVSQTKLMEPFLTTAFSGPQHDDTLAGQRGYGDNRENDDSAATGTDFGTLGNGTFTSNGGSLDDNADVDFVRFTVPAGKRLAVTLTPVGFTYNQGPQNSQTGACDLPTPSFNSLVLNDVGVEVRAPNGTTVLASANSQPAGQTETIPAFELSAAGQYFIRVAGGSSDTVQMYNLSFTLSDGALADLSITKTDGQTAAVPGTPATYTIVARNNSTTLTVNGATVTDTFPAGFTAVTWSCAASAGSSCNGAGGTGNIVRAVNLLPGGTATFTAAGTIAPGATGTLVNTATVTTPAGMGDPTP